ncbi:UNVERIFIED_CONTAM: hypothetical protein PYX00_004164 [Menopon gallinae]|uniref:Actin-related protein 10 n=1 Tax=Menopon gallinae TaxID=328185 RepID=A0AAW2I3W0_9NEOP
MAGLQTKIIVMDVGYRYTKLGVSGDSHPRCIIPTTFRDPKSGTVKSVFDYKKPEELYNNFVEFLHYLYFKKILISPKDTTVVVVDSLLSTIQIRETLAKVLFCHLQIASLLMVPSHVVALYTLGVPTALVVDIGYQEATVIPVLRGLPDLYKDADAEKAETVKNLSDKAIEDIKVRLCFVTTLDRSRKIDAGEEVRHPPCVDYNVSGSEMLRVSGKIRETACEVLFQLDNDEISLTLMLLNALTKCPIDMRRALAGNIFLIGGTSSLPGMKSRLLNELRHYVKTPKYQNKLFIDSFKMHSAPSKENYTAWLGGSIVGSTEVVNMHSITKEVYKREKDIPDWANLKYNTISVDK